VLKTIIETDPHGSVESWSMFSEIDNLNTKSISQAENNYEKTFIKIRETLEQNEQFCCDDESDRLSLTQSIVDILRQNNLIRKEEK
jgi:hypothetical protein